MASREINSSEMLPEVTRSRVMLIVFVLMLWMIAVSARLVYLQTYQHDWLKDKALSQQQSNFKASAIRGLIVDRKGRELARSIEAESFFAVPGEIKDVDSTLAKLSSLVDIDKKELAERLKRYEERGSKFEWIARKVDIERAEKIHALNLDGIYSRKEPKRYYPNNDLAGDVLGFVDIDEKGIAGLEFSENERLQGEAVKVLVEKDASRTAYESVSVSGRSGQTIVLTIDQMIQFYAQQALAAAVKRTGAKSGTAIVFNHKTGEVLAMANAPVIDPNNPRDVSGEGKDNDALQNYEPGSTFKIVTYSAAIEEGKAKPEDSVHCENGEYIISKHKIKDSHPYGVLTFTQALAKSSNIAAAKLSQRVGEEKFYEYIRKFGFGAKTGVELPYEENGLLRPLSRWSKGSAGFIAFGHEIGVTPIQMASAFGVIANNGVRVSPHLIKEAKTEDGTIVFEAKPNETRVVKESTAKTIQQMLTSVISNGTGKRAKLENYTVAGKTGTAQKFNEKQKKYSQSKYVASFVGLAPVNNPAVVIAVILNEPRGAHQGGEVAAPVFREIAEKVLPELNIAPDIDVTGGANTVVTSDDEDLSEESGGDVDVEETKQEGTKEQNTEKKKLPDGNNRIVKTEKPKEKNINKNFARGPDEGKEKRKAKTNN